MADFMCVCVYMYIYLIHIYQTIDGPRAPKSLEHLHTPRKNTSPLVGSGQAD